MDNETLTASDVSTADGATAKETPPVSQGTESVASGNDEQASGSQDSAEGSSAESQQERRRGPSKLDTIRELRARLRDQSSRYDSELSELKARFEQFQKGSNSDSGNKPRKTFWEAPDEVTREITREEFKAMRDDLLNELRTERTASQETQEWKLETSEAAKLIQSQKGLLSEDIADIEDIVRSTPAMAQLRPLDRAKYALYLWNQEKGITDKSDLKAKASSVTGAPPMAGGKRQWTESEMEREMKKFPVDPGTWNKAQKAEFESLDKEFRNAYSEGRVRK